VVLKRVILIAPGESSLPPAPATSVEIYLYDLWRHLRRRVDVCLYARKTVLAGVDAKKTQRVLSAAVGKQYLQTVLADAKGQALQEAVVQIDNRPSYLPKAARAGSLQLILNLHSMTFVHPSVRSSSDTRRELAFAERIVVNSHYVQECLHRAYPTLEAKLSMVHPGVNTSSFHPCHTATEWSARDLLRRKLQGHGRQVILFVGRIIERKGLYQLLTALRELHSAHKGHIVLWVVGKTPSAQSRYGRALRQQAQGLPVQWLGYIRHSDLPALYRAADLFACPSQRPEAFGLVNLEAQASGLPVVASDDWGIRESVTADVTGTLVQRYKSSGAWTRALHQLLDDDERRHAYGRQAVQVACQFHTWNKVAGQFLQLYQQ